MSDNLELTAAITTEEPEIAATLDELRFLVFKGKQGDSGDSAYEEAVQLGFEGTEAEWIASLKGEQGEPGKAKSAYLDYDVVRLIEDDTIYTSLLMQTDIDNGVLPLVSRYIESDSTEEYFELDQQAVGANPVVYFRSKEHLLEVDSAGHFTLTDRAQGGGNPNAVLYTEQTLTAAQQEQARANIGAAAADEGGGMTKAFKQALLDCFENVAWINDQGQTYYDALYAALYPPKTLVSISAAFDQGSAVIYDTNSLDTLKQYLTVTATYDDSSTGVVTNYTLSGELTVGTSVITVLYNGKTTTFNVTVSQASLLPAEYQQVEYIENPSNAYMVTSIPIPLGYTVHGKAYLSAKPSQAVNVCGGDNKGTTTNWSNVSFCCFSGITTNSAGTFYGITNCFDALADLYASPLEFSTIHTANSISINLKNSGGEKSKTVSQSNVVAVDALNVFRASADAPNPFTGRIYLLEVLDTNNQAVARMIPCYRRADNVVGMYDIIGNAFYTSANSTVFTRGADV